MDKILSVASRFLMFETFRCAQKTFPLLYINNDNNNNNHNNSNNKNKINNVLQWTMDSYVYFPPLSVGKDHFENDFKSKSHIWKLI